MSPNNAGGQPHRIQPRRHRLQQEQDFEAFLRYLKQSRGFDASAYQRPYLRAQLDKRLQELHIERIGDYWDYLEAEPDEFTRLLHVWLIQATAFFRDRAAWTYLSETIIPRLGGSIDTPSPIRFWSASCASGEEAYTLAMVAAEAWGLEACRQQVRIFATDIDDRSLAKARRGHYRATDLESLPDGFRDKYFEPVENGFAIRSELRCSIVFGRHNLVLDSPMSHLDLLVCRNTLMYFSLETQTYILSRFCFALKDQGLLFLGEAETPITRASLFAPIHLQHRLFAKVPTIPNHKPLRNFNVDTFYDPQHTEIYQCNFHPHYIDLNNSIEELEVMNEELQASHEELETINKELQATIKELNMLNDELQASNALLTQSHVSSQKRDQAFDQPFTWMQSILASLPMAVIIVDPTFDILMWNSQASELWGLDGHQAKGQSLLHLDIGLPVQALEDRVRSVLMGQNAHEEVILEALPRLGKAMQCRLTCTPLLGTGREIQGAILLMERHEPRG